MISKAFLHRPLASSWGILRRLKFYKFFSKVWCFWISREINSVGVFTLLNNSCPCFEKKKKTRSFWILKLTCESYCLVDNIQTFVELFFCRIIIAVNIQLKTFRNIVLVNIKIWDHSFSTFTEFPKKLTFVTSWYAYVRVRIRGWERLVFRKILRTY